MVKEHKKKTTKYLVGIKNKRFFSEPNILIQEEEYDFTILGVFFLAGFLVERFCVFLRLGKIFLGLFKNS